MFQWIPNAPGNSEVRCGFEGGTLVTFVPRELSEEQVRSMLSESPAANSLLLGIHRVQNGLHLLWNLSFGELMQAHRFAEVAQGFASELVRYADSHQQELASD